MTSRKAVVSKSGRFIAHAWIADQVNYFLESAEDTGRPEGLTSNCAAALVFGSFCVEAFLNSAGGVWVPNWDLLEKKLSPSQKLTKLCTILGIQETPNESPFQCMPVLFKYRNWLAHGKDQRVSETVKTRANETQNAVWGAPRHDQQLLLVPKKVREYLTQADDLIELIEKKSKRKRRPIAMVQTWVAVPNSNI